MERPGTLLGTTGVNGLNKQKPCKTPSIKTSIDAHKLMGILWVHTGILGFIAISNSYPEWACFNLLIATILHGQFDAK